MASQLLPVQENIGESLLNIGYIFILVYFYVYFYIFLFVFFFACFFLFFFFCFYVVSLSTSFLSFSRAFSFPAVLMLLSSLETLNYPVS